MRLNGVGWRSTLQDELPTIGRRITKDSNGRPRKYSTDPEDPPKPQRHQLPVCLEENCIHPAEPNSTYCRMHNDILGARGLRNAPISHTG